MGSANDRMHGARSLTLALVVLAIGGSLALGKDTKSELQKALRDDKIVGDWIYDDIDAGFTKAMREKMPVLVVFR